MIKANELRLGNWVKYDNRYFQIHSIADVFPTLNTDEFGIGVVDYNNISPVELTPEILEAAGFDNGIKVNVFEGNQPRLLEALDRLEQDESLVFTWSW